MIDSIFLAIEIIGVISFAIAGALVAIDKETDLFGVVFLSVMTCFGGGIIRDITIGRNPPAIFGQLAYQLFIAVGVALLVFIIARIFKKQYICKKDTVIAVNNYIDALAIGIFSVSGVQTCVDFFAAKGEEAGIVLSVILGMTSAVGGGMIRDLILRDIPFILRKRIYALAALMGAILYYMISVVAFKNNETAEVVGSVVSIVFVVLIRICATKFKWNLPKAIVFSKMNEEKSADEH